MKRKEEIRKRAEYIANGIMIDVQSNKYHTNVYDYKKECFNHSHLMDAVIEGAEWADKNPRKGLVDIEKVCEWLDLHMPFGEVDKKLRDKVIADLKNAMEEGV